MMRRPPLSQRLAQGAVRATFTAASRISPRTAARMAESVFLRPPRPPPARNAGGAHTRHLLKAAGEQAIAYGFGSGPVVYGLHGWGGRGMQLSSFVKPLLARGRRVVLLDAPGHGEASGRESSMLSFARALRVAAETFGPASGVLAHSMGSSAALLAMSDGLPVERVCFIGAGASVEEAAGRFQKALGLSQAALEALKRRLEERFHVGFDEYDAKKVVSRLAAQCLLVHDREDQEVPIAESEFLASIWSGARLMVTQGLGHHRVLRAPEVTQAVAEFFAP
jgi:pimeloyl-ACP methyl ester carboxylesterase